MRASIASVVIAALALTAPAFASEAGFVSTMSSEQRQATGVNSLSAEQQAALNSQIAAEVALARQGDVKGFAGTFTSRRTVEQQKAAGLDRLSEDQRNQLDRLVASLIAARPVLMPSGRVLTNGEVASAAHKRFETHGSISYTIGGGGGHSFQGGSVSTMLLDTETGSSIEFTYGQYKGDLLGLYGGGYVYGPGYRSVSFERETPRISGRGRR